MNSPDLIIIKRWNSKQFSLLAVAILLILIMFLAAGYLWGISNAIILNEQNVKLKTELKDLTTQELETKRQLVMQKQISKVDQAANYHAGNSMDQQLQQIRSLERELKFFRSIMAPEESKKGLQIEHFNWQKNEYGTYSWQLSLLQAGSQGRALSGFVKVSVVAQSDDQQIQIPLIDENNKDRFNYKFKYFQHLTGTIKFDEGVIPITVSVVAKSATNGKKPVEKQFAWQTDQEKIANVE